MTILYTLFLCNLLSNAITILFVFIGWLIYKHTKLHKLI